MNDQNTDVIKIADSSFGQSFLEDQEVTPVVDVESNLDELYAFQERIQKLSTSVLHETKAKLLKIIGEFEKELPDENISINDWHIEIYRLLELTRKKLQIVRNHIATHSQTS